MVSSPVKSAHSRLTEAVDGLSAACTPTASADDLLSVLTIGEGVARQLDQIVVAVVADLLRRGAFAERGYRNAVTAVADLVGWDRAEARRRVSAAEQVCPRNGLDGAVLPARLTATAERFAAGAASLRHVEAIRRVLAGPSAQRLSPTVWSGAEAELAAHADRYTPSELLEWGSRLVETLDQDGPEPDDRPPEPVNEVQLKRFRGRAGGTFKGHFDDAAMFDAIAAVVDAQARPAHADDLRTHAQRQAEALADACGYVLDHGDVPACGGRRPHLNVLVRLEAGEPRPRSMPRLRRHAEPRVAADAVLRRRGRADRARREGPTAGRRTGHARDPRRPAAGGRRPRRRLRPVRPAVVVVRGAPRDPLGAGRPDIARQLRHGLPRVPPRPPTTTALPRSGHRAQRTRYARRRSAAVGERPVRHRPSSELTSSTQPGSTAATLACGGAPSASSRLVLPEVPGRRRIAHVLLGQQNRRDPPIREPRDAVPGSKVVRSRRSPWRWPRTASAQPRSRRSASCGSPRTGSWRSARPGRTACGARRSTPAPSSPRSA